MLVTEQFVFVHVPKTGGSFVRTLIHTHMQVVAEYPGHASYDRLPPEFAGLPALRIVRNPWNWCTCRTITMPRCRANLALRATCSSAPTGARPFPSSSRLSAARLSFHRASGPARGGCAHEGAGLRLLHRARPCHGRRSPERGGRPFEHLREDLLAFLGRHEIAVEEAFRDAVLASPVIHPARPDDRESVSPRTTTRSCGTGAFPLPLVSRYG